MLQSLMAKDWVTILVALYATRDLMMTGGAKLEDKIERVKSIVG